MITLRFHKELYAGEAVDEAAKVFADYATCDLRQEEHGWCVDLSAEEQEMELELAGEFCNYALGLTIEREQADAKAEEAS